MTNKDNISRNMSTSPKLTKFNGEGYSRTSNQKNLAYNVLDNIQGERFLHSGILRLGFFMLFAIVALTSCGSPENVSVQKQKGRGNLSGIELEFDTTVSTDSINLD